MMGASSPPPADGPDMVHTVGQPSVARIGWGPLAAWVAVPVLLASLLLAVFWLVPALQSNTEDRDPPRRVGDSEQSRPE